MLEVLFRDTYLETGCAEEWGPGKYLSWENDQTQSDQAIDHEVLEVVPPGDEELLRVGVREGVDESGANSRHDCPTDQVTASRGPGGIHLLLISESHCHTDTREGRGRQPPASLCQVERENEMRVQAAGF